MSQTPAGRDKWDTPEVKTIGGKKGRLRKDRYSALLMANMTARTIQRTPVPPTYDTIGGFVGDHQQEKLEGPMYMGPQWFTEQMKDIY